MRQENYVPLLSPSVLVEEVLKGERGVLCLKVMGLWPVVFVERGDFFVVAVPLIDCVVYEGGEEDVVDIQEIHLPFITSTLSFLLTIYDIFEYYYPFHDDVKKNAFFLSVMSKIIPYGCPVDTNLQNILRLIERSFPNSETLTEIRPHWKPHPFKGRQKLEVSLVESLICTIYEDQEIEDVWEIEGKIVCKADLEGNPIIDVTINRDNIHPNAVISNISVHPCVRKVDLDSFKFGCVPPIHYFDLCTYTVQNIEKIPLRVFYQMKEISENEKKLLVQMKLEENVTNQFEYFRCEIPFTKTKKISVVNVVVPIGNVNVSEDKTSIIWEIGDRFPLKLREVALGPATIIFEDSDPSEIDEEKDDPFITGSNGFIKLDFVIEDYSISGCTVEEKNVQVRGNTGGYTSKFGKKTISNKNFQVWNALGEVKYVSQI